MKKNNWKQLITENNTQNYKIIKYPNSGKDYVEYELNGEVLKQRAERFIEGKVHKNLKGEKLSKVQRLSEENILKYTENTDFLIRSGLGDYKNMQSNLVFEHIVCNRTFERSLNNFNKNRECPFCYLENRKPVVRTKTTDQFKKDVFEIYNNEYEVLSEYTGSRNKILVKHKCGTEFETVAGRFLREKGYGCSKCYGKSIGEFAIKELLKKRNIEFESQKTFDDLKLDNYLLLDFFLSEYNLAIEYDGEHHFKPVKIFHNNTSFKKVKESDRLKNSYCKAKGIHLLRIPFWEFNNLNEIIDTVLEEISNDNKSIYQIQNILKNKNIFLFRSYYKSFKARKPRELLETPNE